MNLDSIKPLHDYVLIEPIEQETTLPSGLVLGDSAKEKPQRGKIIAAGQGKSNENGVVKKLNVKKGDEVFYKKWGGTELKIDNKNYLLMKEEDIMALIQE